MFLCLILMLNLWILGFIWRETANFVVNATTIFLPGDSLDRRASSRTRAIDPFWRQINTWRHKMLKFSPFLIWYAFAIMNSFSWIMIAGEKRCLTSMAVWHQVDWHTNFPPFQGAQRGHVRVQSSNCCFPRELWSFVRPRASLNFD